MNTLAQLDLASLGLDLGPDDRVEPGWSSSLGPPDDSVGHGRPLQQLTRAWVLALVTSTALFMGLEPPSGPKPVAAAQAAVAPSQALPFALRYLATEARVLRIEVHGGVRALRGEVEPTDEGFLLYPTAERTAVAHVVTGEGEFVVVWDGTTVTTGRIHRAGAEFAPLRDLAPGDAALSSPPLSPEALLEGRECEPWLRGAASDLAAAAAPLDQVAAMGLIGRHWAPVSPEARAALRAREVEGPGKPVVEWAAALSSDDASKLEHLAVAEAGALLEDLTRIRERAPGDPEGAMHDGAAFVRRRDDLESVAFVLSSARKSSTLRRWLTRVDDEAVTLLSILPPVEAIGDGDRWAAVFVNEPDCWWGAYGRG